MEILIVSILSSITISFIMMKWHIHNTSVLLEKHIHDSDVWFKEQMKILLTSLTQHKHQ